MLKINLDDGTFEHTINPSIENLRVMRDALQLSINEAATSPEPNLPERLNRIQSAAECLGIHDNLNFDADTVEG